MKWLFSPLFSLLLALVLVPGTRAAKSSEKVLYAFQDKGDSAIPKTNLIGDSRGNLYGTALGYSSDGYCDKGCGNVFKMMPPARKGGAWNYTVLYTFTGASGDGAFPGGELTFDASGNLYGTTYSGGYYGGECQYYGCGTVFELSPGGTGGWTETVLYSFTNGRDGAGPISVAFGDGGALYGTTLEGGGTQNCLSCGTVFRLSPPTEQGGAWTESILHRFYNFSDGFWPEAGLAVDRHGALYGTTNEGGQYGCADGCGVVFRLSPKKGGTWAYETIYRFTGGSDSGQPYTGVTLDRAGNLYGTTYIGNLYSYGAVYELSPSRKKKGAWTETTLYSCGGTGPLYPRAGVMIGKSGNLYGTTAYGGKAGLGDVFELKPPTKKGGHWTEVTLHTFKGGKDGQWPFAGLMLGKGGALYGTTTQGGGGTCSNGEHDFGCGTVFEISP